MAKKLPTLKLSSLNAGIHTVEGAVRGQVSLSPDRCVRASNVFEEGGFLRRRPAFKAICHGPQFILPPGQSVVYYGSTTSYDRTLALTTTDFDEDYYIYVGCDSEFSGIYIPNLSVTTTGVTSNRRIKVEWAFDTTTWLEFKNPVDFTVGRCVNGDNVWYHTLTQPGSISWHLYYNDNEVQAGGILWGPTTPTGLPTSKYWVRLSIVNAGQASSFASSAQTLTIAAPGILPFELEPVTSIISSKLKSGKTSLFIGGDRQNLRGRELGAGISVWTQLNTTPTLGFKVEDEGACHAGATIQQPSDYYYANNVANARAWRGAEWNAASASISNTWLNNASDSIGAYKHFKTNATYSWLTSNDAADDLPYSQWRGACLYRDVTPSSATTNNSTTKRCTIPVSISNLAPNSLEHCFIRVQTQGASAAAVGEESQILSNTATQIVCYPHFSANLATDTTLTIWSPHADVKVSQNPWYYQTLYYNYAHSTNVNWPQGDPFNFPDLADGWYHFRLGRPLQWVVPRGEFWDGIYDTVQQRFLITNGKSGILEWDGNFFREYTADTSAESSDVQEYLLAAGAKDTASEEFVLTSQLADEQLFDKPPPCKFICAFNYSIVIANDKSVFWSYPATNVWPYKYEAQIRDPFHNSITGLTVLGDRIVAYTPTSIHSAPAMDSNGFLNFQIESTGVGFLSHRAVAKIFINGQPALIGPSADGVRIYAPGLDLPSPVIDDWSQVLKGGVNTGLLRKAVGCASRLQNKYFLGIARAGFTTIDTVLIFDFITKAWWVWKFPWGGLASIAQEFDEAGNERILFGSVDGHVCELVEAETDDGYDIYFNALSPPVEFAGNTVSPTALMYTGAELPNPLTLKIYLNSRISAEDSSTIETYVAGKGLYGTSTYGNASYGDEGVVTTKVHLPGGTTCESIQYEITGTNNFTLRDVQLLAVKKGQRSR